MSNLNHLSQTPSEIGALANRGYRLLSKLGEGSYAKVTKFFFLRLQPLKLYFNFVASRYSLANTRRRPASTLHRLHVRSSTRNASQRTL